MRIYFTLFCIGALLTNFGAYAQENLSVFDYWKMHDGTPGMSLYKHLYSRATHQISERNAAITELKTKSDWQKRQKFVRTRLKEALGIFPEKTPLNPVITGTLQRDGFRVEKLYFESQPGYFVTAAMFIPEKTSGKAPAILYCSGHSPTGFRSDVYQHTILNYVKKGFVVLAFDPIGQGERREYGGLEGKSSPTKEHAFAGAQSFLAGRSIAYYFVWDGIRAIDYLISRPEVDAARIGITGRSGGGTQTAYIAAVDERILASAPECYITTYDKLWQSAGPQDAEQNLLYTLEKGLDMADFLEVRAPKPTLIVSTTRDMFSIQGVRDAYQEAQGAFRAFEQADYLQKVEDDAPHASTLKNREATYAFFQKHLNNPGSSVDVKTEIFKEEELYVTPPGNVLQHLKGKSIFDLSHQYALDLVNKRGHSSKATAELRASVMEISGYIAPNSPDESIFSGRLQRTDYAIEKYLVKGAGNYFIPVLWLKPGKSNGKTIVLLDDRGKSAPVASGQLADQLAKGGYDVLTADLSGCGELGNGYLKGGDSMLEGSPLNIWFAGIQVHQSLVAVRAAEIQRLATFFQQLSSPPSTVSVIAQGTFATDVLHAAMIKNPFEHIVLINPLSSFQSITEQRLYKPKHIMSAVAGAITEYDLPDLVRTLSDQKLLLINPVDATETPLNERSILTVYAGKATKQSSLPSIKHGIDEATIEQEILKWIK
ncbi:alpha/beta hydrolase [Arundinibacter roseus]|uniref:Xylan esterase n=1 Tax=Arundinibacter roseus TaxID=2070510 RepID=A0A4V2XAF5_9BACT|nr:acetylxylan esterase [Arundinibacter roseus]TDB67395.1 xylan esterase [Arundinibacter roseus]